MSAPLRLHSCWALRNLAYKSDAPVRKALMQVRESAVAVGSCLCAAYAPAGSLGLRATFPVGAGLAQ